MLSALRFTLYAFHFSPFTFHFSIFTFHLSLFTFHFSLEIRKCDQPTNLHGQVLETLACLKTSAWPTLVLINILEQLQGDFLSNDGQLLGSYIHGVGQWSPLFRGHNKVLFLTFPSEKQMRENLTTLPTKIRTRFSRELVYFGRFCPLGSGSGSGSSDQC